MLLSSVTLINIEAFTENVNVNEEFYVTSTRILIHTIGGHNHINVEKSTSRNNLFIRCLVAAHLSPHPTCHTSLKSIVHSNQQPVMKPIAELQLYLKPHGKSFWPPDIAHSSFVKLARETINLLEID